MRPQFSQLSPAVASVPPLFEVQRAIARSLVDGDDFPAAAHIIAGGLPPEARLNLYRNTFIGTLTNALRLSYPAVYRLVGAEFFEAAAARFVAAQPPKGAYLNEYGETFAAFLADFPPAAGLAYLPGVARLEWAVNRALHALDLPGLDLARVAAVHPANHGRISFTPHPSVGLVRDDAPIDRIWRAVLDQDEEAMAAIDLAAGPVWLLVERGPRGIEVSRMDSSSWRYAERLFGGHAIDTAAIGVPDVDHASLIAAHLAAGRFTAFEVATVLPEIRP